MAVHQDQKRQSTMTGCSYTGRRVLNPSDAQIETMKTVLITAFAASSGLQAVYGPHATEANRLINTSQLTAGILAGEVYVAEDDAGRTIGVAIWYAPGRDAYDSEDQRATQKPLRELMTPRTRELYRELHELRESALGAGMACREWLLQRVGVLPEWRGNGVATALINEVLGKTDGSSVVLQTLPFNVEYYRGLGFQVKGHRSFEAEFGEMEFFTMQWNRAGL